MYDIDGGRRLTEFELDWLPGLRGLEAGARRQRRVRAVPARRLRRGAVVHLRGRKMGLPGRERRLAVGRGARRRSSRRRGSARTTASGRCAAGGATSRTRRSWPGSRSIASRAADRGVRRAAARRGEDAAAPARAARADPRRGLRARLQPARGRVHAVLRQRRARRERAGDPARRVPARAAIRACRGRWRRSRRRCCATASCSATAPSTAPTACPAPRARSSRAASGSPTTTPSRAGLSEAEALFERLLGAAQPPRPAVGGVRSQAATPDRQLPPGVLAPRADHHRADHRVGVAEA